MNSDSERYAAELHAMVGDAPALEGRGGGDVSGEGDLERRGLLENPTIPVTPEQLAAVIGYAPTRSGVNIDERTALTFTAVFAAIKIIAESVAMLPMLLIEGDEDSPQRNRAKDHPVYQLVNIQPNPEMTASVFQETLQAHLVSWGNAYARIQSNGAGDAIALWPITPDRMLPIRRSGRLLYQFTRLDGATEILQPAEIIHIPGLGFNGLHGYSPIGMAREAVALGKAAEFLGATFFGNGANVGGVINFPGNLKPEQKRWIREQYEMMHSGVGNAMKLMIMDGGGKYERIGIPPEDAQFLETRKFQVLEVARLFRLPPHMLAEMTQGTGRNIEQLSLEYLVYTLGPWLVKWEQELTRKLIGPGKGIHVKFDERKLLRTDLDARQKYYVAARQSGWMSANEIRREEGMDAGGPELDIYQFPVNAVDARRADELQPQNPALTGKGPDKPVKSPDQAAGDGVAKGDGGDGPPSGIRSKERGEEIGTEALRHLGTEGADAARREGGEWRFERRAEMVRTVLTPLVADVVERHARKEAKATSRGMDDEKRERFYAGFAADLGSDLVAAAMAVARLTERDAAAAEMVLAVDRFARERRADVRACGEGVLDVAAEAELAKVSNRRAAELVERLIELAGEDVNRHEGT